MKDCLVCGADMSDFWKDFDSVACPVCGAEHTTDYELDCDDNYAWWITGLKEGGA